MFGKSKIFMVLAFIFTLIFATPISEAGVVTDRTPLQCYVDKRVDSYNAPNGQRVGWIDPEVDLIQVLEIRPDGWARGTHPSGQKRVERWFRIADLCADPRYSNRGVRINGHRDVYRTRGSNTKFGSVSNEDVIVLAEIGNRSQILYNISGGYKMGWIINSNPVSNRQQAMVDTARRYLGSNNYDGYCQRFVKVVGENIGLPAGGAASALDACNKWRVSTNRNIPLGATVYLRGRTPGTNGYKYGHVGIYAGNGNVIHALKTVKEQSLDSLLKSFDYLGWGWQAGVDLR